MKSVTGAIRALITGLAILGVLAYGAAAVVTVADIVGRRVGMPIEGVVDLVQLFVVGGAWLVMPFAFMTAAHVSVDFLLTTFPPGLGRLLRVLGAVLAVGLLGVMLWQGYLTFRTRTMFGDTSQQLNIPIAWYWYPLLVGLAVSILGVLSQLGKSLAGSLRHE